MLIDTFNSVFGRVIGAALYFLRGLNPWVAPVATSLLTALAMLVCYRLTSNQARIRAIKDKIIAHLLELRLYKDSLPITFRAQGKILWYNLKYLGHSARPMLVMAVPLALTMLQLDLWFGHESLKPGESAIVKVHLRDGVRPSRESVSLEPQTGFVIETPPLRIDQGGELDWRLRASAPGCWNLVVRVNNQAIVKNVVIGAQPHARISPARVGRDWIDQLANPGEPALADSSVVKMIEVGYPAGRVAVFGWRPHWLVVFLALAVIFGFAFKGLLGVEV